MLEYYQLKTGLLFVNQKVLESIHNVTTDLCVDIFIRDDGTYGYEEFRRDYEDGGKWFPLQRYSHQVFKTQELALSHARSTVEWLCMQEES